ncbi:MAG: hypothetical protein ACFCUI_08870 [Bernardetiaceae bacterium]
MKANLINTAFDQLLSPKIKQRSERAILVVAIISYLSHLILIVLTNQGFLQIDSKFFQNPIAAIYTPFSFILVYEVYLLIFFLPKSISFYIGKQYEIITLIVIRRIFKDIANIELSSEWFKIKDDLQFTYDVLTSLILFVLIYYFYQEIKKKSTPSSPKGERMSKFIQLKKGIALLLVPLLVVLAFFTLSKWALATVNDFQNGIVAFKNLNNIFFDEFFTVLIVVDVLLLLVSFFYSDEFHKIIRNSGFVISTILIKVSFSVDGLVNNIIIISAVLFGFFILVIHNKFEQSDTTTDL